MTKSNLDRARGGDDDFAAVGEEPTIRARYPGTCATCGQRFEVGDPVAPVIVNKKTSYHHGACRYPATALLAHKASNTEPSVVGAARAEQRPGKCRATTNKGKPCDNAPQKGKQFCGPHLTQLVERPEAVEAPHSHVDPF